MNTLKCLGFVRGMACPHYQEEADRKPDVHKFLLDGKAIPGYAIDGGAAVHFIGGKYFKGLQFYPNSYAYKVSKKLGSIEELQLKMEKL